MESGMLRFGLRISKEWLCVGWPTEPGILVYVCARTNIANLIFNSCSAGVSLITYHCLSWSVDCHMLGQLYDYNYIFN